MFGFRSPRSLVSCFAMFAKSKCGVPTFEITHSTTGVSNSLAAIVDGLKCVSMVARYHGIASEVEQLNHQYGRSAGHDSIVTLLLALRSLGLRAKRVESNWEN